MTGFSEDMRRTKIETDGDESTMTIEKMKIYNLTGPEKIRILKTTVNLR